MSSYLSVDCGGTKTAFLLCGEKGEQKAFCVLGPANYMVNGVENVMAVLQDGVERVCAQAGIRPEEICSGFIAMAGFGDVPDDVPMLNRRVEDEFPGMNLEVGNDTDNALAGSLLGGQGIHIIAGTGSIGLGLDRNQKRVRSGGWHHLFGGDEGSGYWLGCRLLQHFTKQADGREPRTELYSYLIDAYRLGSAEEILSLVINRWGGEREKIASMSVHVSELAKQGDACAREIFAEAAGELAQIVRGIYDQGEFDAPLRISYSGGVFKAMEYLREPFSRALADIDHVVVEPRLSPVEGGVLLAFKRAGVEPDEEQIENLRRLGV